MKTIKLYAPLLITLAIIAGTLFIPFWWAKTIIFVFIAIIWLTQISIYLLRHKPDMLKRWLPKQKWVIQAMHEKYVIESIIGRASFKRLEELEQEYFNYRRFTSSAYIMTFPEWLIKNNKVKR